MNDQEDNQGETAALFEAAKWYDRTINWSARMAREVPVLAEVLGSPGDGGVIDAGCGTGHQARALAERGYRVVGADASEEMIEVARGYPTSDKAPPVTYTCAPYSMLHKTVGHGFDGLYCLGNALAAAGSAEAAGGAIDQFSACLRPGGRLFIQVLNFAPMRGEEPCVRGPRVVKADGVEYVSFRQFNFIDDCVRVTGVTLWRDSAWRKRAHSGRIYPVSLDEIRTWCGSAGLRVDEAWGSYARDPFDVERSVDLIIAATRE